MEIIRDIAGMRAFSARQRAAGKRLGLVPTMGCLHRGHISLVERAKERADCVVVSIFVNPTQFGAGEDFATYPRTEAADLAACEAAGVDAVFLPTAAEVFPAGEFSTFIEETRCSRGLCGEFRPGHFRGVATVVYLLFNFVAPDLAVFGQKDAQQVAVIKQMVRDLRLPVEIVVAPIVREPDGLALSSRNRYLTPAERAAAPALHAALLAGRAVAEKAAGSAGNAAGDVISAVNAALSPAIWRVQYIAFVNAETLQPITVLNTTGTALLAIAAYLGTTRLIDNEVF